MDPDPYDGPIERADGQRPYNHYLWPTESWYAYRELDRQLSSRVHSRWSLGIIALADGRFSTEGSVYSIEKNDDFGKPCVFATRTATLRIAAARMIRTARASRKWGGIHGGLSGKSLAAVIDWARGLVARETGKAAPKPVMVKEPIVVIAPLKTGLPLFDFGLN